MQRNDGVEEKTNNQINQTERKRIPAMAGS
jgi:hypothetical protein